MCIFSRASSQESRREITSKRNRNAEKGQKIESKRERERERERWRGEQEATGLVVGAKGRSSQGDENFEIKR